MRKRYSLSLPSLLEILNPFRWKSFYYDVETGYYNVSSRYYDPETATFLDVVSPEEMLSAAASIGGLNRDAITFGNFPAITANGFDITTMDDFAVDLSYDPDANKSWWQRNINSIFATVQILFGVLACLLGMELIGLALIGMGVFGLLSPGLQQVMNGLGTITTGVSTIITGISLFAAGPVGWVLGTICLIAGVAAVAIGVNEVISGALGVNYLREWTGMSETTYYAIYTAINIACMVCTIVGQTYLNSQATPSGRKQSGDCRGSECFIAGTFILTAEGYKKIEDIQVGDKVLAYDEETGEQAYKEVVRLFRNETKEWYHILVNEEEIVCTGGHPFYVPSLKEFVLAKNLKVGTELLLSDGNNATIEKISIEKLSKAETTYNFEVEDYHTYYVAEQGVLAHNLCSTELSDEELRNFGQPGKNEGFRVVNGTHEDAMNFVRSQTSSLNEYAPGKFVGYNSRGVEFRVYDSNAFPYTSIRIRGVSGLKGIKFLWP